MQNKMYVTVIPWLENGIGHLEVQKLNTLSLRNYFQIIFTYRMCSFFTLLNRGIAKKAVPTAALQQLALWQNV